jgi:hypothetical protein
MSCGETGSHLLHLYGSQLLVANKPLVKHYWGIFGAVGKSWICFSVVTGFLDHSGPFWTIGTPLRRPMLIALCGIVIDASWQHGSCVGWEHCWRDVWVSQWDPYQCTCNVGFKLFFYFKTLIRFWTSACTNLQWFHILALGLSRIQWPEVISHLRAQCFG